MSLGVNKKKRAPHFLMRASFCTTLPEAVHYGFFAYFLTAVVCLSAAIFAL